MGGCDQHEHQIYAQRRQARVLLLLLLLRRAAAAAAAIAVLGLVVAVASALVVVFPLKTKNCVSSLYSYLLTSAGQLHIADSFLQQVFPF